MNNNKKTSRKYTERKAVNKNSKRRGASKREDPIAKNAKESVTERVEHLDTTRGNNPVWYFLDEKLADQVSQMSFQQLAGLPLDYDGVSYDVPNVNRVLLNPSAGVQVSSWYNTPLSQNSAINMAGFRLYSKLSAFTGRTQSYAPQDVSMMILAFGELISITEWIRRCFGVAYTMNMRNRAYPIQILEFGMMVDADDLFQHLSDYRTQFNTLITLINQLPIPKNIAYFDKCAALYERLYLDAPSSMAQTIVPSPATTWILDEQSYSGGSILKTTPWLHAATSTTPVTTPQYMSVYLNTLAAMIGALLNSSTLQVVYTDILNYATKVSTEFWKFDYLFEEYRVIPEFDANYMLQMHNATITSAPIAESVLRTGAANVTPYNDVYPDVNHNCVFYNPAFFTVGSVANGYPRTGNAALIDMLTDSPTVTDRIECTRYTSCCRGTRFQPTGASNQTAWIDCALPDHYIIGVWMQTMTSNLTYSNISSTILTDNAQWDDVVCLLSNIDWAPRIFQCNSSNTALTGRYTGDVNFYTTVDMYYIRKLHDFVGLALYDLR